MGKRLTMGRQPPLALCVELSPSEREPADDDSALDDPADDEASAELELDDPTIDEAGLPQLDTDDPEALVHESEHDDLLDRGWLERAADDDLEDDATVEDIGLTIDLDGPATDDEGAQFLDLDVGSLLTSLPGGGDGVELDLEPGDREGVAVGTLRELLLPDGDTDSDDREIGDDDRFPAFDDGPAIAPRPLHDDDADIGRDDDLI
jgi:hypothetical protein